MNTRIALALVSSALLAACGGGGGGGSGGGTAGPSISGSASVARGIAIDGDVNDPNAAFVSNDTPSTTQPMPNPGTLTGFASAVPFGQPNSRFATSTDVFDGYSVSLAEGQSVSLTIGNWDAQNKTANDLDLFLYDEDVNLIASSEGIERDETIVVPASGNYIVVVEALGGASTYQLSLGAELASAALRGAGWNRAHDFVAGQAIVTLASDAAPLASASALAGRRVLAGRSGQPLLVSLDDGTNSTLATAAAEQQRAVDPWSGRPLDAVQAERARTIRALKRLAAGAGIASAAPNYRLQASAVPNDPFYPLQWHYPAINLPAAWDISRGARAGNPVTVAVVDTGVALTHPDLAGQTVAGYDFVSDPAMSLDGDGLDADPTDPGDRNYGGASSWHGTHVAGTVAAASDNGSGVAGVAGDARVMPVRVLGQGGGTAFDILQGLLFAAGLDNASNSLPARRADVINMSLGGPAFVQAMQDAVTAARSAGVIVVAAAGNESTSQPSYPAAYDGVISVSSVNIGGGLSDFSNFGSSIDVAAPGGSGAPSDQNADGYPDNVLSTIIDESSGGAQPAFRFLQGTSMAAPHVAGVIALMRAVNPSITPAQVDALLVSGQLTDDIGTTGRDDSFGYGLINAYKAVIAARGLSGVNDQPPVLVALPSRIDFGSGSTARTLRLENQGDGSLSVSSVSASDSWIQVSGGNSVNGGLEFQITPQRGSLPAGAYGGRITIQSDIGTSTVPVTMLVASGDTTGDAGRVYFLLLDPVSGDNLAQVDAAAGDGRYRFRFDGVAAGEYYLVAGSDLDNDDFICGPSESCGAWPVVSAPETLSIDASSIDGLTMPIGVSGALQGSALGSVPQQGYRLRPKNAAGTDR